MGIKKLWSLKRKVRQIRSQAKSQASQIIADAQTTAQDQGGQSSRAIYETFIAKLSALNLPPISFVGHGIGLHLHEEPYLGRYSDTPLEAGMVLGIEPLVYETGYGFGLQNKDIVLASIVSPMPMKARAKMAPNRVGISRSL